MRLKTISLVILALSLSVIPILNSSQAQNGYQDLIRDALSDLGLNCAIMDINSLCVGFDRVETTFYGAPPKDYASEAGDKAPLNTIVSLQSYPIDLTTSTFGIAAMYVKTTNLPAALQEQTALFVTFGDVEIQNEVDPNEAVLFDTTVEVTTTTSIDLYDLPGFDATIIGSTGSNTRLQADARTSNKTWTRVLYNERTAWVNSNTIEARSSESPTSLDTLPILTDKTRTPFQAFKFRTASTQPPSLDVPRDVIMVQSPKNIYIDIWANEHHIRLTGIIFLSTLADGRTQIIAVDGLALVYPDTVRGIRVQAGTSVILGGDYNSYTVQGLPVGWSEFDIFEGLPTNIVTYDYTVLRIWRPSSIWDVITIEVQIEGETPYNPALQTGTNYPLIPIDSEAGTGLERLEWEPFTVGGRVCPSWSLFHSDRDDDWDIYELSDERGTVNISEGDGSTDIMPAHSVDGNYVAYATTRYREGGWEIQVTSRGDAVPKYNARMTFNTGNDLNPVWGPGNYIAWESSRDGNWNIYMFDVSTGDYQPLTTDIANDINPFWFPDGERIVYQSDSDGDWDIYQLNRVTDELIPLTTNDVEDVDPIVSPDGKWIAWLQQDTVGVYNLWLRDVETGEVSQLTDMGVDIGGHIFAPDSSLIAFDARVDGDYEVYIVRLGSRVITAATDNEATKTSAFAAEDRAPAFVCTSSSSLIYHSDMDADLNNPYSLELYQVALPADNAPANPPTRLTFEPKAYDQYPMANAFEERESKENRRPPHPFR
ncbi:MAG: PD40 domain-containing protein [Anaerolineae bacterium]|nr:PD40 domain-containing protein [Anaerolineae bacterium]